MVAIYVIFFSFFFLNNKMIFLLYANILLFASYCWALEVADIKDCPVPKTTERATNIHNLKVTDIEVIAAMGDR